VKSNFVLLLWRIEALAATLFTAAVFFATEQMANIRPQSWAFCPAPLVPELISCEKEGEAGQHTAGGDRRVIAVVASQDVCLGRWTERPGKMIAWLHNLGVAHGVDFSLSAPNNFTPLVRTVSWESGAAQQLHGVCPCLRDLVACCPAGLMRCRSGGRFFLKPVHFTLNRCLIRYGLLRTRLRSGDRTFGRSTEVSV
jgi:hypothetical protein